MQGDAAVVLVVCGQHLQAVVSSLSYIPFQAGIRVRVGRALRQTQASQTHTRPGQK